MPILPDLPMPPDFPAVELESFMERSNFLGNKYRIANSDKVDPDWLAVAQAANGLVYRWTALVEAEKAFGSSFVKAPKSQIDRYVEESALFAFFSNALSAIELSYFAMYGFAAQLEPVKCDWVRVKPQSITPKNVARVFAVVWPNDDLTLTLDNTTLSQPFKDVSDLRNVLSHRGAPARVISIKLIEVLGGPTPPQPPNTTSWSNRPLDATLLSTFRSDISIILFEIANAASKFAINQIAARGIV